MIDQQTFSSVLSLYIGTKRALQKINNIYRAHSIGSNTSNTTTSQQSHNGILSTIGTSSRAVWCFKWRHFTLCVYTVHTTHTGQRERINMHYAHLTKERRACFSFSFESLQDCCVFFTLLYNLYNKL